MTFLGLIIFFSRGSIFLRQYERPLLVVRERLVSLFTLGVDVSFFLYFSFLVFHYHMWGVGVRCGISDVARAARALRPCHLVLVLFFHGVLLVFCFYC